MSSLPTGREACRTIVDYLGDDDEPNEIWENTAEFARL